MKLDITSISGIGIECIDVIRTDRYDASDGCDSQNDWIDGIASVTWFANGTTYSADFEVGAFPDNNTNSVIVANGSALIREILAQCESDFPQVDAMTCWFIGSLITYAVIHANDDILGVAEQAEI